MGRVHVKWVDIQEKPVARVEIDRAEKLNALDTSLISAIGAEFDTLAEDDVLQAVVLEGTEKAWVVGADINEMSGLNRCSAEKFIRNLHNTMLKIRNLPVPVIAKISGYALGAGMELAAACDIRISSYSAYFGMPEVQVGLPSVIEASLLPRLMGAGRASRLMLTGELIDAQTAFDWGFVEEVVPDSGLDQATQSVLLNICNAGPNAIRIQKRLLREWETVAPDSSAESSIEIFAGAFDDDEPKNRLVEFLKASRSK